MTPSEVEIRTLLAGARRASATGDQVTAAWLDGSVVRPLTALPAGQDEAEAEPPGTEPDLAELALAATRLRAGAGAPAELAEATAALQAIALAAAADAADAATLRARLAELLADVEPAIEIVHDGPYLATNLPRVEDWLGCAIELAPQLALCRCGRSSRKPLCDGSHADGFDDAKAADRVPDRRDAYVGQQVTILDNRGICQHAGYCSDRLRTVFRPGEEPFVAPSGGRMDEIVRAVRDCPSGALSYGVDGVEARDEVDRHATRPPVVQVTRDGPYRVTGAVPLRDAGADGDGPARAHGSSREHYALCRCGQSQNKPFCSGMHWYAAFHDPVADPERVPTMFEWAGGYPALLRMTRLFYERYVPSDPLLAPLFATMSADHPERVASWLGEVFGGPKLYSEPYGGYERMLSQHRGRNLKDEWRERWVALLLASAHDAGLPNDPEFRAAFQSYIEWGSRLAVENSQTDAAPPPHMPMPSWGWTTAAGPPGSRVSSLATAAAPAHEVVVPSEGEPLSFERDVRQLFRDSDRQSMRFAFDLWSRDDVHAHAGEILERIRNGTMPCDGSWPADWVALLQRWVDDGCPA